MLNGASVPYATVKLNKFEFMPNTEIIYLGHTTHKPLDMIPRKGNIAYMARYTKAYSRIISFKSHVETSLWRYRCYNLRYWLFMRQSDVRIDFSIP
jgi:hypothetical protein